MQKKFGHYIVQYKNLILKVIDQEQALSDYDVVYHGQKIQVKFVYDVLKEIFSWLDNQARAKDFEYLRIPGAIFEFKQALTDLLIHDFGDITEISPEDKEFLDLDPLISKILLTTNISLFGNSGDFIKESTFYFYFLQNHSIHWLKVVEILEILKHIGINQDFLNRLDDFYRTEFKELVAKQPDDSGNLVQIFIPKNILNEYLYLCGVHGVPLKTATINGHPTNVRELGAEKFIEIYRNNPTALDPEEMDQVQARLFLTNTFFLNPASGVKIYTYNTLDPRAVAEYTTKLRQLINQIMTDWATKPTILSRALIVTSQKDFEHKVNILIKIAQNLLKPSLPSEPSDQETVKKAQETYAKLSALIEVYGKNYNQNTELLKQAETTLASLSSKFLLRSQVFPPLEGKKLPATSSFQTYLNQLKQLAHQMRDYIGLNQH